MRLGIILRRAMTYSTNIQAHSVVYSFVPIANEKIHLPYISIVCLHEYKANTEGKLWGFFYEKNVYLCTYARTVRSYIIFNVGFKTYHLYVTVISQKVNNILETIALNQT